MPAVAAFPFAVCLALFSLELSVAGRQKHVGFCLTSPTSVQSFGLKVPASIYRGLFCLEIYWTASNEALRFGKKPCPFYLAVQFDAQYRVHV